MVCGILKKPPYGWHDRLTHGASNKLHLNIQYSDFRVFYPPVQWFYCSTTCFNILGDLIAVKGSPIEQPSTEVATSGGIFYQYLVATLPATVNLHRLRWMMPSVWSKCAVAISRRSGLFRPLSSAGEILSEQMRQASVQTTNVHNSVA